MSIKICLDAGHYGKYNQSPAIKTYYESDMTWKLHDLLKTELEAYGIQVICTRSNKDADLAVYSRGVASKDCDLFLSIHSNAVGSRPDNTVDYPVAVVQLDGAGDELGQKLADIMHKTMGTKQPGRIYKRKGNTGEYYGVLRGAADVGTMGIILEHSFHTNTKMTHWLMSDSNLKKMAEAEAKVIADYYGLKKQTKKIFRVQLGAFAEKNNADNLVKKLKAAGFDNAIIVTK